MKKLLAILLFILPCNSFAYEGLPKEQVDKFFGDFKANVHTAIDNLYASNPAMQQKVQTLMFMKTQSASLENFYGKFMGYELAKVHEVSPSLVKVIAVSKYELHPITWSFYFYKPKSKWIISQASFFDQFQNI